MSISINKNLSLSGTMLFTEKPVSLSGYTEVVGCFVEYEDKILLLSRQDGKSEAGKYGLPAGKVDSGETIREGMKREIFEETGMHIGFVEYRKVYYVHYPESKIIFHVFKTVLLELPQITLHPKEHSGYLFCTPKEALKEPLMLYMPEIITALYLSV